MKFPWMLPILAGLFHGSVVSKDFRLDIIARDRDYRGSVVLASVPADFPRAGQLKSSSVGVPDSSFQRDDEGHVIFVLPSLNKGSHVSYEVKASETQNDISAELNEGKVTLVSGGKKLLVYQGAESELPRPGIAPNFKRGGYIHPVFSPSGRTVTDDYPANHVHHHGIWAPWTKTEFEGRTPDFWNMGEGKGKVEFAGWDSRWSGPVHAGFSARHRFIDLTAPEPKTVLNEHWKVTSFQIPGADYFLFDLVTTQTCATASALKLPKYHYGGLGVRGNWAWNGIDQCTFLTSNGETNRVRGNETQGNWCYMGGEVDGAPAGIAILCHPENFRAPQGMRLHPSEPFFCYAPSQGGDWSIEPGKPYVARYRFVVMDGAPDKKALDRLWEDYVHPPFVQVTSTE